MCILIFASAFEGKMNQKRRGRMRMAFEGAQKLQELCHKIVGNEGMICESACVS